MNKFLKFLLSGVVMLNISVATVYAYDDYDDYEDTEEEYDEESEVERNSGVAQRMDCNTMKTKISELTASGENAEELAKLQQNYRRLCSVKSKGARATRYGSASQMIARMAGVAGGVEDEEVAVVEEDGAEEETSVKIEAGQKKMCKDIKSKIDFADEDTIKVLKKTYKSYCKKKVVAPDEVIQTTNLLLEKISVDATVEESVIGTRTKNGACAGGEGPNKYGCCAGEKFKDMGDLKFACCPEDGGECQEPLN